MDLGVMAMKGYPTFPKAPRLHPQHQIGPSNAGALGMLSTSSLPSLPDSLWPRVVALEKIISMGPIELFDI